ncbi:MAG: hypothetical protein PHQ05_14270 [Sterolibacterium sp.]|nr:hypothetical protein [Sterolibacterium sp.]
MNQESLVKWQSIASIAASIAIPLILAIVGYVVQDKISTEGLRKDYVQIAISILKERQDEDLRKWAVKVLDENSPIPFSKDVRMKLEKGTVFVPVAVECPRFPDPPEASKHNPGKLLIESEKEKLLKGDLNIDDVISNYGHCDRNAIDLGTLQKWIRAMQASDQKFRGGHLADGKPPQSEGQ